MITPRFRKKNNGVPILSKKEIDAIAEQFVSDFQQSALNNPEPFDVETFIEMYLGMTPDYQYLSHNGVYLGMTVFNDTDKVPVYDPRTERAEYISARANTVIIDRRLIEDLKQEHRLRFTQGHEGGHGIFHPQVFQRDPNQLSFLEPVTAPIIQCRTDAGRNPRRVEPKYWTDKEWMEWQANAMSSALLMPRPAVSAVIPIQSGFISPYRKPRKRPTATTRRPRNSAMPRCDPRRRLSLTRAAIPRLSR